MKTAAEEPPSCSDYLPPTTYHLLRTSSHLLVVVDWFLGLRLVDANPQRTQEPPIVSGEVEGAPSGQQACGCRHLGHRGAITPIDEPDDGFEGYPHVESRVTCLGATGLDLGVFCHGGGNRVGQLLGEPVHDVIHYTLLLIRHRAGIRGAPNPNLG